MATLTLVDDRLSDTNTSSTSHTAAIPTALICDNFLLRSGLRHILQDTPFALATAASESRLLQHAAFEPALILVDTHQATERLLEIIRQLREQFPQARVVALADQFDLSFVRSGYEVGVNGFCSAASAADVLTKSLELVMLGETVLPFEVLRPFVDGARQNQEQPLHGSMAGSNPSDLNACKLSVREREILGCLTQGEPNKVIARKLDITEATIKVHVKAILRKIGASNRTQAAIWASQRLTQRGGASVND
ncbi:response regulator transcription factor [Microvirga sp. HBU67558]|uniref:LuxR C-terminal-related transcriptional regulator n=1 Tax=Microvirga TaxID=186650 RepID=UPI001B37B5CF|nr:MULTISPECIES: response regulator transcription factor [unclassified Microvirga]MBQ0819676.1 response regulator transcription factor [Microvirga sp. HBU67558]